jgi:hypothetical protein
MPGPDDCRSRHRNVFSSVLVHLSGLAVFAGPGFEVTPRETGGSGREEHAEPDGGTRFLLRVGGQYAFPLRPRWGLTSFVALDLVNEHEHVGKVVVYGVKLVLEL